MCMLSFIVVSLIHESRPNGPTTEQQLKHTAEGSTVSLEDGTSLTCRLILDCSGHYSELVEKDGPHNPGVQIAYGAEVEVKGTYVTCGRRGPHVGERGWLSLLALGEDAETPSRLDSGAASNL